MPRERWFYAKDMRRTGPLPRRQLVESLLALTDPRGCLIWRHGLPAWTPAREVPEIDRHLAPFVRSVPAQMATAAPASSPGVDGAESVAEHTTRITARTGASPAGQAEHARQPNVALYFGGLAALLVLVVGGWLLWPGWNDTNDPQPPRAARSLKPGAGPLTSETGPSTDPGGDTRTLTAWSDQEGEVPPAELQRLRGVGGWSGDRLTITLYNGSTWRITEILVRTSRLRGDEFQDGETPHRLLPVGAAPVDAATAELLQKVAPDRRKPGVNPLDTGPFEASVGPQPEAYRWRIEGARGYPPAP